MKNSKTRNFIVILFLFIVVLGLGIISRGKYLEYSELGQDYIPVFWEDMKYWGVSLIVTFVILFIAIYSTNKRIATGLKKFFEAENKKSSRLPNMSISFILATIASIATSGLTANKLILFLNSTSFEIKDEIFHYDMGYYLFQKPFLEYILWYLIAIVVAVTVYAAIYYIIALNTQFDGIKSETLKKSIIVKQLLNNTKVLSILIALQTFLKTQDLSSSGFLTVGDKSVYTLYGAGITDVTIKLWGYRILCAIIVISVFMAISAYKNKKNKKVIGCVLMVPSYLCLMVVVLAGYNAMFIKSNELDKQKKYINYNIQNTRSCYNIDIDEVEANNNGTIEEKDVADNEKLLNTISLANKDLVLQSLNRTLTSKGYYGYNNTQIGLYNVDGENRLVYVSPREIVTNDNSYNNSTYQYTHGYGAVVTSATSTEENGILKNYQKNFTDNVLNIKQPRIYFGTQTDDTIVTNTPNNEEFDYPISEKESTTYTYDGKAGLSLGTIDRFILAVFKGDGKLAFSANIGEKGKILINRNIVERAKTIMPYLMYDENPYIVVTDDGKMIWVLDAYTTSSYYPYSQKTVVKNKEINYIRNSVKVLIDAYDGTTKFYITDRTDPVIMAYRKAYNGLFVDLDEQIPEDISKHFVYPTFLYNIQANMLKRYHTVQPDVLYRTDDVWDFSTYSVAVGGTSSNTISPIQSYYTMVKSDDETEDTVSLVIPYLISGKQNITSYLSGTYKNGNAKLKIYNYPEDSNVLGLLQLDTQIEQNEEIYKQISSLNVSGTKLSKNIVVIPIDSKLLYVEAIYQQYINEDSALPVLKKVVVASGNKVAIGNNLKSAITNLVSQNAIGIETEDTEDINGLIELIIKANKNLEESTTNGDWEMVGKDVERLQKLIDQLEKVKAKDEENKDKQENLKENNSTNALNDIITEIEEDTKEHSNSNPQDGMNL